jgi:uncharacterized protein (DUF433 family)
MFLISSSFPFNIKNIIKKGGAVMNSNCGIDAYLGTYSIPNASLYICATLQTNQRHLFSARHLYRWANDGLAGGYLSSVHNTKKFINFKGLISLRVIAAMRANGMQHCEIITAENVLKKRYGCEYPFAAIQFWTLPPKDVFVKEDGILLSASRHFQSAMEFIEEDLKPKHNMTFDIFGTSASWRPLDNILLDPQIQFGDPCIEGTRVPTQVIWSFFQAGDSIDTLSMFYGIQRRRLENAISWENNIQEILKTRKN